MKVEAIFCFEHGCPHKLKQYSKKLVENNWREFLFLRVKVKRYLSNKVLVF